MNRATSGSAGCAEVPCLARAGVIMLFLSVKLCELSLAAWLVRGVMGASIAREVAQRGELGLAPSQLLPAPLHRHVACLQHSSGNLCCLTGGFRQEGKCCLVLGKRWGNISEVAQLWKGSPEAVETPSLERFKCTWMQPWATWFNPEGGSALSKGWVGWLPETPSNWCYTVALWVGDLWLPVACLSPLACPRFSFSRKKIFKSAPVRCLALPKRNGDILSLHSAASSLWTILKTPFSGCFTFFLSCIHDLCSLAQSVCLLTAGLSPLCSADHFAVMLHLKEGRIADVAESYVTCHAVNGAEWTSHTFLW